jgi:hypothetical protein
MEKIFFDALKRASVICSSAADCNNRAANLLIEAERHKDEVRLLKKKNKDSKGPEKEASLRERHLHNETASQLQALAELLIKEADAISYDAFLILFGYERYVDFRCLLAFLQTLQPRQAAEILKHLITIVTNEKIAKTIEEEEAKVAKQSKKTLFRLDRWHMMLFVVQNALLCERIKINHRLNFSTNFLSFHVASLQYQGKMAQIRCIQIPSEPLKMFKKRRLNLLTISAVLCFLCRKFLTLPERHHISQELNRLLQK